MARTFLCLLALVAALPSGCADPSELHDLRKERDRLVARRDALEKQIGSLTTGKTAYTEAEKQTLGPLAIELNKIKNELAGVNDKISRLD